MADSLETKQSSDINVGHFHQILIWPLLLHKLNNGKKEPGLFSRNFFGEVTDQLEAGKLWS